VNITQISFIYNHPLKQKVVKDLKLVTEHVGFLEVSGTLFVDRSVSMFDFFDRYNVDIDAVKWNGADIRQVLGVTGGMDDIIEASIRFAVSMLQKEVAA
jgi:hypothetical protein